MDIRHIRYFLQIREESNFTRAAEKLGIGQPPLSMQIRDLEREIGAQLFQRTSSGAVLTEAGKAFYEAVKHIPDLMTQAKIAAARAGCGETGSLTLGFTGTVALHKLTRESIRGFRTQWPEVELNVNEANSLALMEQLAARQIDVALLRAPQRVADNIQLFSLFDEPLIAALPVEHPQASQSDRLDLKTLQQDRFVLTPDTLGTSLREATLRACEKAGFTPASEQPAPHIVSILAMVSAGLGVSLVPESTRQFHLEGVKYRRLCHPAAAITLSIALNKQNISPAAENFYQLVNSIVNHN
ncbi:LysR family transcriptional regulator [Winslowiella sp. 2C04]|uniref:LysR family transcriptional regulator n=1 Tax=Winslowiella sp. 2C04 TaxID=3416179 RepID=UPI003CF398CB